MGGTSLATDDLLQVVVKLTCLLERALSGQGGANSWFNYGVEAWVPHSAVAPSKAVREHAAQTEPSGVWSASSVGVFGCQPGQLDSPAAEFASRDCVAVLKQPVAEKQEGALAQDPLQQFDPWSPLPGKRGKKQRGACRAPAAVEKPIGPWARWRPPCLPREPRPTALSDSAAMVGRKKAADSRRAAPRITLPLAGTKPRDVAESQTQASTESWELQLREAQVLKAVVRIQSAVRGSAARRARRATAVVSGPPDTAFVLDAAAKKRNAKSKRRRRQERRQGLIKQEQPEQDVLDLAEQRLLDDAIARAQTERQALASACLRFNAEVGEVSAFHPAIFDAAGSLDVATLELEVAKREQLAPKAEVARREHGDQERVLDQASRLAICKADLREETAHIDDSSDAMDSDEERELRQEYSEFDIEMLRSMCVNLRLPSSGLKTTIIGRLIRAEKATTRAGTLDVPVFFRNAELEAERLK